jgi:hypothetical protein
MNLSVARLMGRHHPRGRNVQDGVQRHGLFSGLLGKPRTARRDLARRKLPGVVGFDPFGDVQAIEMHGNSFLTSSERQERMRKEGANSGWGATTRQAWSH